MQFNDQLNSITKKVRHLGGIIKQKVNENLSHIEKYIKGVHNKINAIIAQRKQNQAQSQVATKHVLAIHRVHKLHQHHKGHISRVLVLKKKLSNYHIYKN